MKLGVYEVSQYMNVKQVHTNMFIWSFCPLFILYNHFINNDEKWQQNNIVFIYEGCIIK